MTKKKAATFRLDAEVLELIKKMSQEDGRSQANFLEKLIRDTAKNQKN